MPDAPTGDSLVYIRADGTRLTLVPRDQRFGWPANRPLTRVLFDRPDSPTPGEWVPQGSPDILLPPITPTTPTTPVPPPPPPPLPTDGPLIEPGQSWAAALRQAAAGTTVYLRAGREYAGPGLTDPTVRLATGVKLAAWPVAQANTAAGGPKATVRVAAGSALALWSAAGFSATDIRFVADSPTAPGVRFTAGCRDVALVRCEVVGFTFGVTSEGTAAARNVGVTLDRCHVHDNYHPANQDSSGLFAAATDALTLTDCLFAHNGWREDDPVARGTVRNHSAYVCGDCGPAVVRRSAFARAASHGLQLRSGGTVEACSFLANPIHLSVGLVNGGGPIVDGGVVAVVKGCTFAGTRDLAGSPRGWAIEISNARDVTIEANAFARDGAYDPKLGNFPAAVKLDVCRLDAANPQQGRAITAKRVVLTGNAATWPFATVWRHPSVPAAAVTVQPQWPPADVAATTAAATAKVAAMTT